MYTNFTIKRPDTELVGYQYPCEEEPPTRVVCLLHGAGEHAGRYGIVADILNQRGIVLLAMDLRGHGRSPGKRGHCAPRDEVLADVDALIETAQGTYPGLPITLYGHCLGGNIALDYRRRGRYRHQLAGYVITAPWIRLVHKVSLPLYYGVRLMARLNPTMTMNIAIAFPTDDPAYPANARTGDGADPLVHGKISMRTALDAYTVGQALQKEETDAAHADPVEAIPCLVLHGTQDRICDIEGTRDFARTQRARNFRFEELPGYPHAVHSGAPGDEDGAKVIGRIGDFICRL